MAESIRLLQKLEFVWGLFCVGCQEEAGIKYTRGVLVIAAGSCCFWYLKTVISLLFYKRILFKKEVSCVQPSSSLLGENVVTFPRAPMSF